MLSVRLFIELNSKLCLVSGGFLNILLIWLVCKRTPREMQSYSKIVLQTCFCDLANLVIGDFVQPVLFLYNGIVVVVSNGIAGQLAWPYNIYAYYVWIFFAFFAIMGIIVQFLYRYLVVCKEWKIGNKGYFGMLGLVALGLALYFVWLLSLGFPPPNGLVEDPFVGSLLGHNATDLAMLNSHQMEKIPPEVRMQLRGTGGELFWIMWHIGFVSAIVLVYSCIAYFGRKMVLFTKRNMSKGLQKNAELNKQLIINLILQAIIPVAAMLGWVVCAYACIFVVSAQWFNYFTSLFATPTQNWTSVLNPLVTIFTIKAYRRAIFGGAAIHSQVQPTQQSNGASKNAPPFVNNLRQF